MKWMIEILVILVMNMAALTLFLFAFGIHLEIVMLVRTPLFSCLMACSLLGIIHACY